MNENSSLAGSAVQRILAMFLIAIAVFATVFIASGTGIAQTYKLGLAATGAVLGALALYRPQYGMLLFCYASLLPPLVRHLEIPVLNNSSAALAILCVTWVFHNTSGNLGRFRWRTLLNVALVCLILVYGFGVFRGYGPESLPRMFSSRFITPVLALCTIFVSYNYFLRWNFERWAWVPYVVCVFLMASFVADRYMFGFFNKRASGYLGGNSYGNTMVVLLPLLISQLTFLRRKYLRFAAHAFVLLTTLTILWSTTRAAMVALVFLAFGYIMLSKKVSQSQRFILVIFPLGFLIANTNQLLSIIDDYFSAYAVYSTRSLTGLDQFSSGRVGLWQMALEYISLPENFFWGGGPRHFELLVSNGFNTHNHILMHWCDYGLIGVIAILFVYQRIVSMARKAIGTNDVFVESVGKGLLLSCIAATVVGLFSHGLVSQYFILPVWIQCGMCLAALERYRTSNGEE